MDIGVGRFGISGGGGGGQGGGGKFPAGTWRRNDVGNGRIIEKLNKYAFKGNNSLVHVLFLFLIKIKTEQGNDQEMIQSDP